MHCTFMGESFQDCSWIQDFEADFPKKVSLKILNLADSNSFFDLFSVYLKMIDRFAKVQDFLNFELSPMHCTFYLFQVMQNQHIASVALYQPKPVREVAVSWQLLLP